MAQFPLLIAWQRYFPARSQSRNVEALFNILVVEREVTNLCHDKNMLDVPIPINRNESGSDLDSLDGGEDTAGHPWPRPAHQVEHGPG